ncbi:MAG: phosphotransferase [Ardenticatenaceae bacterium]|nr:phosphotransferase [Ardenticatenaceae bacterium]
MKTYEQLTRLGRLRRLRGLAVNALAQYELDVCGLTLVGTATNLIYRVETADHHQFALRLAYPGWRTLTDLQAEAMWLAALARDTDICVPVVEVSREGTAVITTTVPGIDQPHYATLMRWLPGTLLGKRLTTANLYQMGELFAKMHQHGASWQPPAGFTKRKFTRFLSRGEPDVLLAEAQLAVYTPPQLAVFQEIRARVEAEYARLDPADLRVIHCDLWHDNIKIHHGQLCPFDFEDTVWGYRLHDMAMALLDLMEETTAEQYEVLFAAFQQGYTAHLDWPAGDMTVLQLGRLLWLNNHLARHHRQWWGETAVPFYTALFERYLASGELIRPLRA